MATVIALAAGGLVLPVVCLVLVLDLRRAFRTSQAGTAITLGRHERDLATLGQAIASVAAATTAAPVSLASSEVASAPPTSADIRLRYHAQADAQDIRDAARLEATLVTPRELQGLPRLEPEEPEPDEPATEIWELPRPELAGHVRRRFGQKVAAAQEAGERAHHCHSVRCLTRQEESGTCGCDCAACERLQRLHQQARAEVMEEEWSA